MCSTTVAGSVHDDGGERRCVVRWWDATSKPEISPRTRLSGENFASNPHLILDGGHAHTILAAQLPARATPPAPCAAGQTLELQNPKTFDISAHTPLW